MPVIASSVFTLVDQIAAASSVAEVWDIYLGAAADVRLPYGAAAFYPPDPTRPIHLVAEAMPENWMREYVEQDLADGDLLTERARHSNSSFEWSLGDWEIEPMTPVQRRWRDHNLHHGILGGLVILDFRRGENMVMVVCGRDGPINSHDRLALYFAGQEAMLRIREMAVLAPMQFAPLSPRERECLQWAAAGKTDREIGQILSLSEKTVNIYIERAKAKFGANSRAQALIHAMRRGLISAA